MAYNDQNIFAKILRGETPCVKVAETEHTLAFMDIMPQAKGHTLVIPKFPAEDIFTADPDFVAATIRQTQIVAAAVKKAMQCAGIVIAQLNGKVAGQTVFHLHFHIVPRYEKDATLIMHAREMADMAELQTIADKIKSEL